VTAGSLVMALEGVIRGFERFFCFPVPWCGCDRLKPISGDLERLLWFTE